MALKELRLERKKEARKYTLHGMAEILGVSVKTYMGYEEEPSKLTYEQALKAASTLLCDPKELF